MYGIYTTGSKGEGKVIKKEKSCTWCGKIKPLSKFHINRQTSDGHQNKCAVCVNSKKPAWKIPQGHLTTDEVAKLYYVSDRTVHGVRS